MIKISGVDRDMNTNQVNYLHRFGQPGRTSCLVLR